MKALILQQLGGPEQLRIDEIVTPEPGPGQVRVRLRAAALNRRDVWITLGQYPGIRLPCILGSDGAGTIDALGPDTPAELLDRPVVVYPRLRLGQRPALPQPDLPGIGNAGPRHFRRISLRSRQSRFRQTGASELGTGRRHPLGRADRLAGADDPGCGASGRNRAGHRYRRRGWQPLR
jgi:hypothetical protein